MTYLKHGIIIFVTFLLAFGCKSSNAKVISLSTEAIDNIKLFNEYWVRRELQNIQEDKIYLDPFVKYIHQANTSTTQIISILNLSINGLQLNTEDIESIISIDSALIENYKLNISTYQNQYAFDTSSLRIIYQQLFDERVQFLEEIKKIDANDILWPVELTSIFLKRSSEYLNYCLKVTGGFSTGHGYYKPMIDFDRSVMRKGEEFKMAVYVVNYPILEPDLNYFIINGDTVSMHLSGNTVHSLIASENNLDSVTVKWVSTNPITGEINSTSRSVLYETR